MHSAAAHVQVHCYLWVTEAASLSCWVAQAHSYAHVRGLGLLRAHKRA